MKTNELRKKFLDYFKEKGHKVFASDSLVPDDPTVLFTSAGMNQFKPYFLGEKTDIRRAVSCQKCLRTADLERVGQTSYHHTFFEMLGNFSFGDYFKKEAIEFAWEFVNKNLNIDSKDLWISVYNQDEEAYEIWEKHIGIAEDKIIKLGEDSNFWPANAPSLGPNGPCGPCSEIFFDRGKGIGCGKNNCSPACACGRFVEFWNLVFTQFNRVAQNQLQTLPQKNIDTGMGLERMAAVLQGKESNFEIDILYPAVQFVRESLKVKDIGGRCASLINAIVDYSRAAAFAIADGVYPSNEERGYVIRKIIRKAVSDVNLLNYKKPFIYKLVALFGIATLEVYPDISAKKDSIVKTIKAEEEKFIPILEEVDKYVASKKSIAAQELFYLYDTKGFPLEAIEASAKIHGTSLSLGGFDKLISEQQERSRKKSMFDTDIFKKGEIDFKEKSEFAGYGCLESAGRILRLVDSSKRDIESLEEKSEGLVILDKTPFYAESGGQLSDRGCIKTASGEFTVEEVFKVNDAIVHKGKVVKGAIAKGTAYSYIDKSRRNALMRAHTATHLLQAALRSLLGSHIMQQGSLVDEDRLRFDFTQPRALSAQELEQIEDMVNTFIVNNDVVNKNILSLEQAKKGGALAFFKDKYKDEVRVVSVGDYSKELCAGTHLNATAEAISFVIIAESSIASGIRRIEALTGLKAYEYFKNIRKIADESAALLKCSPQELTASISRLFDAIKEKKEEIFSLQKAMIAARKKEILEGKKEIGGVNFITYIFTAVEPALLLYLCDLLKSELTAFFAFFISHNAEKDIFVCYASDDIIQKGLSADIFINRFKDVLALRGGGKKSLVQGVIQEAELGDYRNKINDCFSQFVNK
jgi:alanyl-tRNA synthetase